MMKRQVVRPGKAVAGTADHASAAGLLRWRGLSAFFPPMTMQPPFDATPEGAVLVDARGLNCPLPLLEARRALQLLPPGTRLVVLATDPAAPSDFTDFALARGLELEVATDDTGVFRLSLRPESN